MMRSSFDTIRRTRAGHLLQHRKLAPAVDLRLAELRYQYA